MRPTARLAALLAPLLIGLAAAPGLAAQQVSPAFFTTAPGNSSESRMLFSRQWRWMQVHDDLAGAPRLIHSIAFRPEEDGLIRTSPAVDYTMDLWMSTAASTSNTIQSTFASNHGSNLQQVLTPAQRVSFAVAPEPAPMPGFDFRITLPQPYLFDGAGALCWEMVVRSSSTAHGQEVDSASNLNSRGLTRSVNLGTGCKASGFSNGMWLSAWGNAAWTRGVVENVYTLSNQLPQVPALLVLGLGYAPMRLPGTDSAPSGPCDLAVPPSVLLPMSSNPFALSVPSTVTLHGQTLTSQAVSFDVSANALGVVTSNAFAQTFAAPHIGVPMSKVISSDNMQTWGSVDWRTGVIIEIR